MGCTAAGGLLKKKLIVNLYNCLRRANDAAQTGNSTSPIRNDIAKLVSTSFKRVTKLLSMMKRKCLIKDTANAKPARVTGVFKEQFKTKIKRSAAGALTPQEKADIAKKVADAVKKARPDATNVVTTVDDTTRRQLRPGRALAANDADVTTSYDVDTPSQPGSSVTLNLAGTNFATVGQPTISANPTTGSLTTPTPITINTQLPTGAGTGTGTTGGSGVTTGGSDTTPPAPTEAVDTGAKQFAFGTAAVICASMWFF